MASRVQNPFRRAPARLFGKIREARQPGTPLKVTQDTSIWEIYNNEAEIVDRECIKDWNDSLNTLLIFVRSCLRFTIRATLNPQSTGGSLFRGPYGVSH